MAELKQPKLWRIVLVISLALNFAILGLLVGFGLRSEVGGRPPQAFEVGLGPFGQALTREQRHEIGDELRRNPDVSRMGRREVAQAKQAVIEILRTEPFDAAALETVLSNGSVRARKLQDAALSAFMFQIGEMSYDERVEMAERIERFRGRRPAN